MARSSASAISRSSPAGTSAFCPTNFGGFWWDAKAQKYTFNDPHVIEGLSLGAQLFRTAGVKAAVTDFRQGMGNYDSPQNPFMAGTQAIVSQGTFFSRTIIAHQKTEPRR